jgi:hypothetical protein
MGITTKRRKSAENRAMKSLFVVSPWRIPDEFVR